ncbi:MAG: pyridoxal-dependent decarboxylase [Candidatus Aminicenantes bacterium]|jgi:glutamate/tyrosine decarboxylase-like PLP-dependent enzyme
MEHIFKDFQEIILPEMTHWQHPSWFAYFPANNSPPSVLAELLTAGMGAKCMIDALNKELIERINQTGKVLLIQTTLKGKFVLRMAFGARTTEERHIHQAWDLIVRAAKELLGRKG